MSLASESSAVHDVGPISRRLFYFAALAIVTAVLVAAPKGYLPTWATVYPTSWQLPLAPTITRFVKWLMADAAIGPVSIKDLTRAFAWICDKPLWLSKAIFATGFVSGEGSDAVTLFPPIPWFALIVLATVTSYWRGGVKLALGMALGLLYLAVFGQWASAMITLASVVVSSLFGIVGGLIVGLCCLRWRMVERLITPVLDLAQTLPVFAYLLPMLIFFGFGPVSAMVATVIYAMPPMVRVTMIAIRNVPEDVRSLGTMTGCTSFQTTWKVLIPSALPGLMVGVNQVIMLSLNVVIIASMIGAGGLGYDVLSALRRLDIGSGLEAGIAITILAILLDRLAQSLAQDIPEARRPTRRGILAIAVIATAMWLGVAIHPDLATFPSALQLSTGNFWNGLISWINVNYYDAIEAVKNAILLNLLLPVKRFMLALPWPWVVVLLGIVSWRFGGWRLAVVITAMTLFLAVVGLWQASMITVYLCGVSTLIAALIGIPIGIASAGRPRVWAVVEAAIDTLQTLPSFVYLIPIVMLFQVGDFTAMIAIVLYALAPAIRYTAHGVSRVSPALIEAGKMTGCTPRQVLTRIQLPLAMPEIILGLNQTIMLALSMLVITALVGTRDLGQETYASLAKADVGRGVVAGLCVALIGMIVDRLLAAMTVRLKDRLGAPSAN